MSYRNVEERFWAKVRMTHTCWIWVGARTANGYGNFWHNERHRPAHRSAYEILVGEIPDGTPITWSL